MAEIRDSFFGANAAEEGDDLRMASTVVFGEAGGPAVDAKELTIRLRVFDGETRETRFVEIEQAEGWDWKDPGVWRVINGWQVNSFGSLLLLLHQKQQKGIEEIELLEAPRFSMLSGG
jgi:hypothetical protein